LTHEDLSQQIIERGHVTRGWLGVEIQDLTPELAESFGLRDAKGVVVAGVLKGGPADKAGLQAGDVVQRVAGRPVANTHEALNAIAEMRPGTQIVLDGLRDGKEIHLRATSGERPTEAAR
jgi:S1-C subfamily serine protease